MGAVARLSAGGGEPLVIAGACHHGCVVGPHLVKGGPFVASRPAGFRGPIAAVVGIYVPKSSGGDARASWGGDRSSGDTADQSDDSDGSDDEVLLHVIKHLEVGVRLV